MDMKDILIITICSLLVVIYGKEAVMAEPNNRIFYHKPATDHDKEHSISSMKPYEGFQVLLAERLLGALADIFDGLLKGRQSNEPIVLLGNGLKFGLYVVLGYNGKEDCYQRCWCMLGSVLGRFTNATNAALVAVRYVAPIKWHGPIDLAEEGALGIPCNKYRCGPSSEKLK